jgi:hypothetical protein
MLLPKCWFDAEKCRKGIEALKLFRTEWDQDKRVSARHYMIGQALQRMRSPIWP